MAGLRIGIDGTCLGSRRGYGRFLRELLGPLVEEDPGSQYVLFADRHVVRGLGAAAASLPCRVVAIETSADQTETPSLLGSRRLGDMLRMGRAVARAQLDVMYFPSVSSFHPVPGRIPVVVALHDVIPHRYAEIVFPRAINRWLWEAKVALARRRASAIVTVSEWSRRGLVEMLGVPEERIHVALEAPGSVFRPCDAPRPAAEWLREHGLPVNADYFIYVGGFNPHKNLVRCAEAFARLVRARPDRELHWLVIGDYEHDPFHTDVEGLRAALRRWGLDGRVHLPGFVPDEALRRLYAGALALLLPSLEEGFGLPALEAAACGTPCVATRRSPLPQLLEKGGLFVDPEDTGEMATALARIGGDPGLRASLAQGALAAAAERSWSETAERTRAALHAAVGLRR